MFQTAQKVFEHLEDFTANQNEDTDFSGMLSVGILDHFEEPHFISSLEKVIKKFPKIKLNIQAFDSDTINKMLLENELDLGLAIFNQQSPRLKYVKIGEERLQYFISDKHPLWSRKKVSRDDLEGHKVAWIDNHSRTRSDLEINIFVENPKYKMQFFGFSNNLSGGLALLLSGHTVVPLSENYGDILSKLYPIKKLPFVGKARQLNHLLAHNPSRSQSAPIKMMIEMLMGRNQ